MSAEAEPTLTVQIYKPLSYGGGGGGGKKAAMSLMSPESLLRSSLHALQSFQKVLFILLRVYVLRSASLYGYLLIPTEAKRECQMS